MKKIKIAFFIDALKEDLDGVSNTSHQIIKRLKDHDVEPIFFTPMPPEAPYFKYPVHKTRYLTLPYAKDYRLAFPKKEKIYRILDEFNPDLIHWSTPSLLGKCAVNYALENEIPNITIYHAHFNSYLDYLRWVPFKSILKSGLDRQLKRLYKKADLVLAPTVEMEKYLDSIGVPDEKLNVWGRGVDCVRFNPNKSNTHLFKDKGVSEGFNILFVSRLVHYKETDGLIRLSHKLPEGVNLIIVGDGPEEEKMKEECKESNTYFWGRLEGEKLAEAYASCDQFIFPSISETFGNVILEAMASGLPIVAAEGGGPMNIIENGKTGFLIEPRSTRQMMAKIEMLRADSSLRNSIGQNARLYAESVSWKKLVSDLVDHYGSLLGTSEN